MALTVSSIVGNVSGFLGNDKYNVWPATKDSIKGLIEGLDGIDWSQQDLVSIIETKVDEVAEAQVVYL